MRKILAALAATVMAVLVVGTAPAQAAIYANSINIKMGMAWVNTTEEYIAVQDKVCADNKEATVRFQNYGSNTTWSRADYKQCDANANAWYFGSNGFNVEWFQLCYPLAPSGWHCTEKRFVIY